LKLNFSPIIALFFILLSISGVDAQTVPDSLLHKKYSTDMRYNPALQTSSGDSVNMVIYDEVRRFDSDAFLERYATASSVEEVYEELHYYYADFLMYASLEKKKEEGDKMKRIARLYGNKAMEYEADFLDITFIYENKDRTIESIRRIEKAIEKVEKRGDLVMKIRMLYHMFELFTTHAAPHYYDAFKTAEEMLVELEKVDENRLPDKRRIYFEIGLLYYRFRDYKTAIPLLEKALTNHSRYFFDRANLQARNTLGLYYRNIEDIEQSDKYFISMLESPDMVKYRPMYDAIAIANLGHNRVKQRQYDEAIKLYHIALPITMAERDSTFASGIVIGLGNCYLAKGQMNQVKAMIDTAYMYIHSYHFRPGDIHRYRDLYPLLSKYYARIGNTPLSEAYMDSTFLAYRRFENEFNALTILRAKQEVFDVESQAGKRELRQKHRQLMISLLGGCAILVAFFVIAYYYRKTKQSYKALALKARQWANTHVLETADVAPTQTDDDVDTEMIDTEEPTAEDKKLTDRVHDLMINHQIYKDSTLTLDSLALRMNITRGVLSRAINRTTGKNFNRFVNEYRIKEAVRIISSDKYKTVYIDELSEQVGFNSRQPFYRAFKQITGLSPAEFKKDMSSK